jgi:hypothetical protein
MTLEEAKAQLREGYEYEIISMVQGVQRYPRKSRMSYLGIHRGTNELQFNARPAAGTQTIRSQNLVEIHEVGKSKGREDPKRYVERRA